MSESVGNKIKIIRKSKKLSTYDLADITGLSQPVISKLENGNRRADIPTLEKIANGLNVKLTDLVDQVVLRESVVDYVVSDKVLIDSDYANEEWTEEEKLEIENFKKYIKSKRKVD